MARAKEKHDDLASVRETIESLWIGIVVAMIVRAFVLEAFLIPTGSMAPQLMGQHVRLQCPDCGYEAPHGMDQLQGRSRYVPGLRASCPNCGQTIAAEQNLFVRGGDRVLVMKYLYQLHRPERWDVVVFHNPQTNADNYIKRLVGLPGEAVRIVHGDVFVHTIVDRNGDGVRDERDLDLDGDGRFTADDWDRLDWQVARKSADMQQALWQVVYDTDYRPLALDDDDEPFWTAEPGSGWQRIGHGGTIFGFEGAGGTLRFGAGWRELFRPTNGYNSQMGNGSYQDVAKDLLLQTTLVAEDAPGTVQLELSALDRLFAARVATTGEVELLWRRLEAGRPVGPWQSWGSARTGALRPGQARTIGLSHADWQVTLWIDEKPLLTSPADYRPDLDELVALSQPGNEQALPTPRVALTGIEGAFQLWHTGVFRDVFYTNRPLNSATPDATGDYPRLLAEAQELSDWGGQPSWGSVNNPIVLRAWDDRPELDEFFMLGDNSSHSLDSRLWTRAASSLKLFDAAGEPLYRLGTVPRYSLIGKAFFVYWPAGGPLLTDRIPLVPDVGRMRMIR